MDTEQSLHPSISNKHCDENATEDQGVAFNSTQLNNVNASTRALIWSTTLDGRGPRSTAASTDYDVQVHAVDPTGLVAAARRDTSKKKLLCSTKLKIHVLKWPAHHEKKFTHSISSPTRLAEQEATESLHRQDCLKTGVTYNSCTNSKL